VDRNKVKDAWELIQQTHCLFLTLDTEGRVTFVNRYALEYFRQREEDILGKPLPGSVPQEKGEGATWVKGLVDELLNNTERPVNRVVRFKPDSGQERWLSWTCTLLPDDGRGVREVLATGHDVTELGRRAEELRLSETKYRRIISTTTEGFVLMDKGMCILDANEIMARNLGYPLPEVLGTTPDNYFTKQSLALYLDRAERLNSEDHLQFEADLVTSDGREIPHLVTLSVLRDDDDEITGYVSFLANLTELRRAQQECSLAETRYRKLYENAPQGIFQSTLNGRMLSVNPALAMMMGFSSPEEVFASTEPPEVFYFTPEDRERLFEELSSKGVLVNYELKVRRRDGVPLWLLLNLKLSREEEGEPLIEGLVVDNTARKLAEEELRQSEETFRYLAQHDNLTGLFNTRFLYHKLNEMIARGEDAPFSVVFMDMDNFKAVVDAHGHLNGSRALQEVAQTLRECLEEPSFGVAYGGDEFVLVLPGFTKSRALQKAEQVRNAMRRTTYLSGKGCCISLTASFGVSTYPDDAVDLSEILSSADRAMFKIKTSGKNGVKGNVDDGPSS
jgi:diguanylate cyclase (GGDEF)-like protein/PAS domain S-box-containing protein